MASSDYRPLRSLPDGPSIDADDLSARTFPRLWLSGPLSEIAAPELVVWTMANDDAWAWRYRVRDAHGSPYEILIDAEVGSRFRIRPLARTISAPVYVESPVTTPVREARDLVGLDSSGYLQGPYSDVRLGAQIGLRGLTGGGKLKQGNDGFRFVPGDGKANQVNAFYHINHTHDFYKSLGIDQADFPLPVLLHYDDGSGEPFLNAMYDPADGSARGMLAIGQGPDGEDFCLDTDVVYHEYSHFVMAQINPDFFNYVALETAGMNEGFADYFAGLQNGNPRIGEFISPLLQGTAALRDLSSRRHYPEDTGDTKSTLRGNGYNGYTEPHVLGELIGGAMWDLRNVIGSQEAAKLLLSSLSLLGSGSSFPDVRAALLETDQKLFQSQYSDTIKAVFDERGINTMVASYLSPDSFTSLRQQAQVLIGPILKYGNPAYTFFDPEDMGATFVSNRTYHFSGYVFDDRITSVTLKVSDAQNVVADNLTQTQDISKNDIPSAVSQDPGRSFEFPLNFPDSLSGQTVTLSLSFKRGTTAAWTSSAKVSIVSDPGASKPVVPEPPSAKRQLLGDGNGDRKISIEDATLALRVLVGLVPMTDEYLFSMDSTPLHADGSIGDNRLTTSDASVILRKAVGL
jgi:hypothetical protein